jgi:hypothetical protein
MPAPTDPTSGRLQVIPTRPTEVLHRVRRLPRERLIINVPVDSR